MRFSRAARPSHCALNVASSKNGPRAANFNFLRFGRRLLLGRRPRDCCLSTNAQIRSYSSSASPLGAAGICRWRGARTSGEGGGGGGGESSVFCLLEYCTWEHGESTGVATGSGRPEWAQCDFCAETWGSLKPAWAKDFKPGERRTS